MEPTEGTKQEHTFTPQQQIFIKGYFDPKSETWGNALQSALKAGYSQEYSENITHLMPAWLSDAIGDSKLIQKALKNLTKTLENEDNPQLQWDATKFTLKGLQSTKFGDKSQVDHTSKGEAITYIIAPEIANKNAINTNTEDSSR